MTIREYYNNYKQNKKYKYTLPTQTDATIAEFYDNCIQQHVLDIKNVLSWHNMLIEYANRSDAILWVRYYESGSKSSGRWNNRRACRTEFKDGFSYVFVSNYDAHEIFNMVRLGVTPDLNEFHEMMQNYEFPLHYDSGKSCEESDISCYPKVGSTRGGILTPNHLYLAHINGIKSKFLRCDGKCRALDKEEVERIFPRGDKSDWKDIGGRMMRIVDKTLSNEDKALVRAHFLRFVDPLNYYVVPGRNYETNDVCTAIGEHHNLNLYVAEQYEKVYGKDAIDKFRKVARIAMPNIANGGEVINISYGTIKLTGASASKPKATTKSSTRSTAPAIIYSPADEQACKIELLKKKQATLIWKYRDGHEEKTHWNANKLSVNSNLSSNVRSSSKYRKDVDGLIEIHVIVDAITPI